MSGGSGGAKSSWRVPLLALAVAVVTVGVLHSAVTQYYRFRHMMWDWDTNQLCGCKTFRHADADADSHSSALPDAGAFAPSYCDIGTEQQFTHFIWFVTDGLALTYMTDSITALHARNATTTAAAAAAAAPSATRWSSSASHAQTYAVTVPGYKFSHAIYTSWLTGQPSYNYHGQKITGDSILAAAHRAQSCRNALQLKMNERANGAAASADESGEFVTPTNVLGYEYHYRQTHARRSSPAAALSAPVRTRAQPQSAVRGAAPQTSSATLHLPTAGASDAQWVNPMNPPAASPFLPPPAANAVPQPAAAAAVVRPRQTSPDRKFIRYAGPEWSFLFISSYDHEKPEPNPVLIDAIDEGQNTHDVYASLLGDRPPVPDATPPAPNPDDGGGGLNLVNEQLSDVLQTIRAADQNLITHTGVFDKAQHHLFKAAAASAPSSGDGSSSAAAADGGGNAADVYDRTLRAHALKVRSLIDDAATFVDANPNYLLIISSDHGVDVMSPAGIEMLHGDGIAGNIGYFTFYNPRLHGIPPPARGKSAGHYKYRTSVPGIDPRVTPIVDIDVVDVAPTISKFLYRVDIPQHSVGIAQNYYGAGADSGGELTRRRVLQQNVVQLCRAAQLSGRGGSSICARSAATADASSSAAAAAAVSDELDRIVRESDTEALYAFATRIKNALFVREMPLPLVSFLLYFLAPITINVWYARTYVCVYPLHTVLLYAGCYLHILFCWWQFKPVYQYGVSFLLPYALLFVLNYSLLPSLPTASITSPTSHASDSPKSSASYSSSNSSSSSIVSRVLLSVISLISSLSTAPGATLRRWYVQASALLDVDAEAEASPSSRVWLIRNELCNLLSFAVLYLTQRSTYATSASGNWWLPPLATAIGWISYAWLVIDPATVSIAHRPLDGVIAGGGAALAFVFRMTASWSFLYVLNGFHSAALLLYGGCGVAILYFGFVNGEPDRMAVPLSVVILFITGDATVPILYVQYRIVLAGAPALCAAVKSASDHSSPRRVADEEMPLANGDRHSNGEAVPSSPPVRTPVSLLRRHATIAYTLQLIFGVTMSLVRNTTPSFTVDPNYGGVGMLSWNDHRYAATVLMFVARYGVVWLSLVYAGTIAHGSGYVLGGYLILCFGITGFGYLLSLYFYSIEHAPEEALSLVMLYGSCVLLYTLFWCRYKPRAAASTNQETIRRFRVRCGELARFVPCLRNANPNAAAASV